MTAQSSSSFLQLPIRQMYSDDSSINTTAQTTTVDSTTMDYLPSSPCPSASGSELSFASDAESTDYASTPPTSPTRVQEAFRRSLDASSSSPKQSLESLFSNFRIPSSHSPKTTPPAPLNGIRTPLAVAPVTPSRTRPMLLSSLSSKRGAHSSPGLLDLSSVPRFPSHPSVSSFSSSSATTPQGGLTPNGSTPKAVPDRPGLFSRWSTDSEGSGDGNEDRELSACTSPDCEVCEHDRKAAEDSGTDQSLDYIRSPLPVGSPSTAATLLPPAPKPHQQGFSPFASPFVEAASSSSPMAPSTSASYFSQQPRHVSSPASLPASRTCKKKLRNRSTYASSSSSGSSDCFLKTPSDSPSAESPLSSPAIPAGPSKPLTRSQGLRIRDEGSRAKGRWGNRSLSSQLSATASGSASGSSTIKTASALLEGTISPAATTTDPLRVKLRQIPGAITPDSGMPPSPSPQSGTGIQYNQPHQQHHHLYNRSLLTPELPRSPLHISSLPNSSSGNKSPNSKKDTSKDIFSKSFSFAANANRESPLGSPKLGFASPRSTLPSVKENTNPYFAGYA